MSWQLNYVFYEILPAIKAFQAFKDIQGIDYFNRQIISFYASKDMAMGIDTHSLPFGSFFSLKRLPGIE